MILKKLVIVLALLLIYCAAISAQNSTALTSEINQSQTETKGKIYKNELYNFSFETPSGWTEIPNDNTRFLAEAGKKIIKPNAKGKTQVDKSIELTQTLLHIAKYPSGTSENASLICAVEVNPTPQATIAQSAFATQQSFEKNFGYTIISPAKQTMLGGKAFYSIKVKKTVETGVTIYQSVYLRKVGNKVLQFVFSYAKPEDGLVMEKSLLTLKFTK